MVSRVELVGTKISWEAIQQTIQGCRVCDEKRVDFLRVPADRKRQPPVPPPLPTRLYFVSVAPPSGGAYFWDESQRDALREGLFRALGVAEGKAILSCSDFVKRGFYLTPAVKCPSQSDGKDHAPAAAAISHCEPLLQAELQHAMPKCIIALGRIPFKSLCRMFSVTTPSRLRHYHGRIWEARLGDRSIHFGGTYFPGNNRHKGFDKIVTDLQKFLKLERA